LSRAAIRLFNAFAEAQLRQKKLILFFPFPISSFFPGGYPLLANVEAQLRRKKRFRLFLRPITLFFRAAIRLLTLLSRLTFD
jgi:hypothetical protein